MYSYKFSRKIGANQREITAEIDLLEFELLHCFGTSQLCQIYCHNGCHKYRHKFCHYAKIHPLVAKNHVTCYSPGRCTCIPASRPVGRHRGGGELGKLIGYARVATAGESLDLQREALDRAGIDCLFTEVASRANADWPQLKLVLSLLGNGDTLVVWKVDRIGRSLKHLSETVEYLDNRGIGFRSLKENIDTTTAIGKLAFHAFVAGAEFERDLTAEETPAGWPKGRDSGRRRGRKPKLDKQKQALAVALHKDPSNSLDDICQTLQIGLRTLHRYVSKQSTKKAKRRRAAIKPEVAQQPGADGQRKDPLIHQSRNSSVGRRK